VVLHRVTSPLTHLPQIILPAIVGHVPDDMVRCVAALLDFAYLARRSSHDTAVLAEMEACLARFHQYRVVFEIAGICPNGFDLPRQHSLVHYVRAIFLFGSPNGLCSSITESKHIDAVKKPWRRSRRYKALLFILTTNTRMSKVTAARTEFGRRGMLRLTLLEHARREANAHLFRDQVAHLDPEANPDAMNWEDEDAALPMDGLDQAHGVDNGEVGRRPDAARDVGDVEGPRVDSSVVTLSSKPGS
jgi:hypothetical protein